MRQLQYQLQLKMWDITVLRNAPAACCVKLVFAHGAPAGMDKGGASTPLEM